MRDWRTRLIVFHGQTLESAVEQADAWTVKQDPASRKDFGTKIEGHEKSLPFSLGQRGSWTVTIQFLEYVEIGVKAA